jgi:hypothetical protein
VLLDLDDEPLVLELGHDPLARREAIHAGVLAGVRIHGAVAGHDHDRGQAVALADQKIVGIVGGGDLDRAGAERRVDTRVGDNRNLAPDEGQLDPSPDHPPVALVVGVHRHGGVAQHGFGAGSGDRDRAAAAAQRIANGGQGAPRLLAVHLLVGERGLAARTPMDDVIAAIDEPLLVQGDEDLAHRPGQPRVEGEAFARPIARATQGVELRPDAAVLFFLPAPDSGHEGLPAQVMAGLPFGEELALDSVLSGDARVVGPRQP